MKLSSKTKFVKNPQVDKYIKQASPFAKPILNQLRKLVEECSTKAKEPIVETIKWDSPFYTYNDKILCGMGTFKVHCKFWIKNWIRLTKEKGEPAQLAMEKMLHIYKVADLPSTKIIKSLLQQAMKLNETGAKPIKRTSKKKPPLKTPRELMFALRANPKALGIYENFSPSHQRHYIEWITEAKTEETREKRLEKAIDCISAGKTRHWL